MKFTSYYAANKKRKALTNGFDWAAGKILRKELTPGEIERNYISGVTNSYDLGVVEAINVLCDLKVVVDDRI